MTALTKSNINAMRTEMNLASALVKAGDYDGAIQRYAAAAELGPEHPQPHIEIARIWHRKKVDLDKALIGYVTAAQLDSRNAQAHYGAAIVLTDRLAPGDEEAAIKWLNIAIELDPRSPLPHKKRGQLLGRAKRYAEAALDFAEAFRLDPGDVKAKSDMEKARKLMKESNEGKPAEPRSASQEE